MASSGRARSSHQREGKSGPGGGGRRGAADDCALGCGCFGCGREVAGWAGGGGADAIFCLMSSSTACSAAMFWAICSCLAAICSTLRRTKSRLNAKGASCCAGPGEVAATTGGFVVEMDSNQASVGALAMTISFAISPYDCQPSVAPTPMRTAMENRVRLRNIRRAIDGRSLATSPSLSFEG